MQRVHMDDLSGFLMSQSDEWELLSLPAIAEFEETIPLGNGHSHRRQFGEALSPEREPLRILESLKLQIGSDAFSAQYQQTPVPPGGAMIKRQWIRRYADELPSHDEQLMTLQSWDTASKGGPENDWSVCTTWILTRRKRWYLLDVWRRRVDYPALKAAVKSLAKQWRPQRILVEDAVTGTALVQELREEIDGIIPVKPVGDKVTRMAVASAKIEAGQVFLPQEADWLPDLEAELFAFPGGRHDDQCDSISQALFDGDRNMPMEITEEILAMFSRIKFEEPHSWAHHFPPW
jgi:predicted phage terminase large subunit-like protein